MRDSYERFFELGLVTKQQFFDFGLGDTIYAPSGKAKLAWVDLKKDIESNEAVCIRKYGQNGRSSYLYQDFYAQLLGNDQITPDRTNNENPTKSIRRLTGYAKTPGKGEKKIRNYQISHIFGRTKNPYAFTAPWNIVYMPKMLDPFTGHEAKGEMIDEFTALFEKQSFERFQSLIEDFNAVMTAPALIAAKERYLETVEERLELGERAFENLKKSINVELSPILKPI